MGPLMSLFLSHFANPRLKSIKPSHLLDKTQASLNLAFVFVSTKSKQWDTNDKMKVTSKNSDGSVKVMNVLELYLLKSYFFFWIRFFDSHSISAVPWCCCDFSGIHLLWLHSSQTACGKHAVSCKHTHIVGTNKQNCTLAEDSIMHHCKIHCCTVPKF